MFGRKCHSDSDGNSVMRKINALKKRFPPPWRNRIVYLGGEVHKTFGGNGAEERFAHEIFVLRNLFERGCPFVPQIKSADPAKLCFIMENCGKKLPLKQFSWQKIKEIFRRLEDYGVRHDDPKWANMVYRESDGEMVLLDFEFSTFLDE